MPAYIKFDGIDGEVVDKDFQKFSEVLAWSWGASNSSSNTGGGGGAGKVVFQDLHISKVADLATLDLWSRCALGTRIKSAVMGAVQREGEGNFTFLKFRFEGVAITSINDGGSGNDMYESVSLNYTKIQCTYSYMVGDGSVKTESFGWDLAKNTSF